MEFFLKDYFRKQEMHHKIIHTKFGRKIPPGNDLYYWDLIWKPIFIAQLKTAKPRHLNN